MSVDKLIAGNWKMNGDMGLLDLYLEKFSKFSIFNGIHAQMR